MNSYTYKDYNYKTEENSGTMLYNQYNVLINLLELNKPKRICQLGSGQSTSIFEQYKKKNKNIILFSIEHDYFYIRNINTILCSLIQNTSLTLKEKTYFNINRYDKFEEWLQKQEPFDFILIDGPLGWGFREKYDYSRIQLLSFIVLNKIANNSIVLYHDSERKNAKHTLQEFQNIITNKGFLFQKDIIPSPFEKNTAQLTCYKLHHD